MHALLGRKRYSRAPTPNLGVPDPMIVCDVVLDCLFCYDVRSIKGS